MIDSRVNTPESANWADDKANLSPSMRTIEWPFFLSFTSPRCIVFGVCSVTWSLNIVGSFCLILFRTNNHENSLYLPLRPGLPRFELY